MACPTSSLCSDFSCPICCDLVYKPCVNVCGHLFCFWCIHKAMSPYAPSQCPLCRTPFRHLPAVCNKLHLLLQHHAHEAYAERQQEVQAEERELGLTPIALEPSAPHPEHFAQHEFLCDDPACRRLLHRPVALNCGHVVCQRPCMRVSPDGSTTTCPACDHSVAAVPAVCKQLDELLCRLFPAEQAQRAQQTAAAAVAAGPPPAAAAAAAAAAAGAAGVAGSAQAEPTTPRGTPQEGGGEGEGGGAAAAAAAAVSPSLLSAIHRRRGQGGQDGALASRVEENLCSITAENYVHHGVGCDVCGMYPIQGARYQCKDCPEAVGFDLCGRCMEAGPARSGRFNQSHTPEHRMVLVRPRVTAMHILQAANPEMPFEQLMWLLELAIGGGPEGEQQGGGPAAGQPSGEVQQQQQQQQQGGSQGGSQGGPSAAGQGGPEAEGDVLMPRWRGPRPAPDPTAQDPSPSAIPPGPGASQGAGGGGAEGPDTSLVFIPLEALLGGDEAENNVQAEQEQDPASQQQQQQQQEQQQRMVP